MTIIAWIVLVVISIIICVIAYSILHDENTTRKIIGSAITLLVIAGIFFGLWWYFHNTADGNRQLVDQQSNLRNGIERDINIYTAHGDLLASYHGKIDIEDADGGYVKFDLDGRRYIYYNCLVETIANIDEAQ